MSKKEVESIVLVSPSGHKYQLSVSDTGNLTVSLVTETETKEG